MKLFMSPITQCKSQVLWPNYFSDAYLQTEVEKLCKEPLTINIRRGSNQYNRILFGVKRAPAIFQQVMDIMFSGLSNVMAYMDGNR